MFWSQGTGKYKPFISTIALSLHTYNHITCNIQYVCHQSVGLHSKINDPSTVAGVLHIETYV